MGRELVFVALVAGVALSVLTGIAITADKLSCKAKAAAMGVKYTYGFNQGCMVAIDNTYVPIDQVRYTIDVFPAIH